MAKQTLVQAIHLAFTGKDRELGWAIRELNGKPVGAWGETEQAHRVILDQLPARNARSYTRDQFEEAAYLVAEYGSLGGMYRTRSAGDAAEQARRITEEAELAALDEAGHCTLIKIDTDHYGWVLSYHKSQETGERALARKEAEMRRGQPGQRWNETTLTQCVYRLVQGRLGKVGERVRYA